MLVPNGVKEGSDSHREPSLPPAEALTSCSDQPQLQLGLAKRSHVVLAKSQLQLKERRAPPLHLLSFSVSPAHLAQVSLSLFHVF